MSRSLTLMQLGLRLAAVTGAVALIHTILTDQYEGDALWLDATDHEILRSFHIRSGIRGIDISDTDLMDLIAIMRRAQ